MMSVSEFFSSDPEPPWIVDVATDLESYTDIHTENEGSTSTAPAPAPANFDNRTVSDMEVDMPSASHIETVRAHLFMLREIESARPFRIESLKGTTGAFGRRAAGRSKPSRKRKFVQME